MAHDGILFVTLTHMLASWSIQFICAGSAFTSWSSETRKADAVAVGNIATGTICAVTFLAAVQAVRSNWALVLAAFTHISRPTNTLASQVLAQGTIVAVAALTAVGPIETRWAGISAHRTRPPLRTEATPSDRVTGATILAVALARTLVSMCASWAKFMA